MKPSPIVFVLTPAEFGLAREISRGVRAYALSHGRWSLRCGTTPRPGLLPGLLNSQASGAILFCATQAMEDEALACPDTPVVNVSGRLSESRLPQVIPDNAQAGQLAAQHLLERGFRQFAFAGHHTTGFGAARHRGFSQTLADARFECQLINAHYDQLPGILADLPKPIGILGVDDIQGQRVVDACHDSGIAVPEQVAVVGVDNDEHVCSSAYVPLTSVDTRGYDVGFRAGQLLDQLLQGHPPPTQSIAVPVGPVATRRSTDTVAVADPDLAFAMQYIREHACDPLRIESLMEHLSIGRRTLEKRFKAEFGRTLHNEIRRVQIDHAQRLLTETELKVPDVAERCGFCDRKIFTKVFGEAVGTPPGQFRQAHRRR